MEFKLINIQRLFILSASILMYALGGGVSHYLGANILPFYFWLGLLWVVSIHVAGFLLIIHYSTDLKSKNMKAINILFGKKRLTALQLSILLLSFTGVYLSILLVDNKLNVNTGIFILMTIIGLVVYVIPPFSWSKKGFQEIGLAIFQGCLIPALGFLLFENNFHRMLLLLVFPMTLLSLAFYIALNFSTFAHDQKIGRLSFVILNTWQRSVPVHHVLIISGYLFFLFAFALGIPISIMWITFLTLPLAIFQIFWLKRIVQGGKPMWTLFNVLTSSVFGLTAYLFAFTLWTY